MGKRGPKPKGKVKIEWSSNFAYAIGLIVTDGNISRTGSRVTLVSKDIEQINNYIYILGLDNKIGIHNSGSLTDKLFRVQFRDQKFCCFLNKIGIMPAKSKILNQIKIPQKYFFDYLRGCLDGDGSIYATWDKRWKSSYIFYLDFVSASENNLIWLRDMVYKYIGVMGYIDNRTNQSGVFRLRFAKNNSLKIINKMYADSSAVCLTRKKLKIKGILDIVDQENHKRSNPRVVKLADTHP